MSYVIIEVPSKSFSFCFEKQKEAYEITLLPVCMSLYPLSCFVFYAVRVVSKQNRPLVLSIISSPFLIVFLASVFHSLIFALLC
jgi:hypothetical protein